MCPQAKSTDPELVRQFNELAEYRLQLQLDQDNLTERFETRKAELAAEFEPLLAAHAAKIQATDAAIRRFVTKHGHKLIAEGKRSFATSVAVTQLRTIAARRTVTDWDGVMSVARSLRVVRHIAIMSMRWVPIKSQFFDWLDKHPQYQPRFAPFISTTEASESLTIKPNTGYTVFHDGQRISPPSVTIKS